MFRYCLLVAGMSLAILLPAPQARADYLLLSQWGTSGEPISRLDLSTGILEPNFITLPVPQGGIQPWYPSATPATDAPACTRALALGPDGQLYVSEYGGSHIWRYDPLTGALTGVFSNVNPTHYDMEFGPDGTLYGSVRTSRNELFRYDMTTGARTLITYAIDDCWAMAFGPDGNLYVGSRVFGQGYQVLKFNGATGASMGTFIPSGLGCIHGMTFGPDGDLYLTSDGSPILRYSPTGVLLGDFGTTDTGPFLTGQKLLFAPNGDLYVASDRVYCFDGQTGIFKGFATDSIYPLGYKEIAYLPVPEPGAVSLASITFAILAVARPRRREAVLPLVKPGNQPSAQPRVVATRR